MLCDCVSNAPSDRRQFYDYVKQLSEICEFRAICHKDLKDAESAEHPSENNLYLTWVYLNPDKGPAEFL